ncbi:MAG: insulinase family protein [Luteimonas sp.]|nr:insulinase family protein [Luteimonas sp.]
MSKPNHKPGSIRPLLRALVAGALVLASSAHAGIAERAQRSSVAGVDVIVYPMDVPNVVTVLGTMPLGDAQQKARAGNAAVPRLASMLLQQGTKKHDKFQIAETLSGLGAEVELSAGSSDVDIYGHGLTRDLPTVVGLIAEQLREPAFTQVELDKAKVQLEAQLRDAADSADSRAYEAMMLAIFPASSANAPIAREDVLKAIPSATIEQVRQFHADYFGPAHMTLVFAGDVDAAKVAALVQKNFAGWRGGVDFARDSGDGTLAVVPPQSIAMADKATVSVFWGEQTGLRFSDADYLPLSIGVGVLGSGFTGRLMSAVRAREGLTYGISGRLVASDLANGGFMINTTFAPELLDKGVASTSRELQAWWKDGITEQELAARKKNLVGGYQVRLGSTIGMASALVAAVKRDVGLEWLDQYPQDIQATTVAEVNGAIKKYIDPARLVEVKAGTFAKP